MYQILVGCAVVFFLYKSNKDNKKAAQYEEETRSLQRSQEGQKQIALSHGWKIDEIGEVPSGRYELIWMYKKIQTPSHGLLDMRMLISTEVKVTFYNEFLKLPEVDLTDLFSGEQLEELERMILLKY